MVFINHTNGIDNTNPELEYIALVANQNISKDINIQNWKIFNYNKNIAYRLPVPNTESINKNDRIIIITGQSPIGKSFRLNKCSGFLSQFKTFYPSIKQNCPAPKEFLKNSTSTYPNTLKCFEEINKLNKCEVVIKLPVNISNACKTFLQKEINIDSCVKNHKTDEDFNINELRLFLNLDKELWNNSPQNIIILLDANNKVISGFVY